MCWEKPASEKSLARLRHPTFGQFLGWLLYQAHPDSWGMEVGVPVGVNNGALDWGARLGLSSECSINLRVVWKLGSGAHSHRGALRCTGADGCLYANPSG